MSGITLAFDGFPSATIDVSNWGAGVTDANAELIDIAPDGAIPIYELIADPQRRLL